MLLEVIFSPTKIIFKDQFNRVVGIITNKKVKLDPIYKDAIFTFLKEVRPSIKEN